MQLSLTDFVPFKTKNGIRYKKKSVKFIPSKINYNSYPNINVKEEIQPETISEDFSELILKNQYFDQKPSFIYDLKFIEKNKSIKERSLKEISFSSLSSRTDLFSFDDSSSQNSSSTTCRKSAYAFKKRTFELLQPSSLLFSSSLQKSSINSFLSTVNQQSTMIDLEASHLTRHSSSLDNIHEINLKQMFNFEDEIDSEEEFDNLLLESTAAAPYESVKIKKISQFNDIELFKKLNSLNKLDKVICNHVGEDFYPKEINRRNKKVSKLENSDDVHLTGLTKDDAFSGGLTNLEIRDFILDDQLITDEVSEASEGGSQSTKNGPKTKSESLKEENAKKYLKKLPLRTSDGKTGRPYSLYQHFFAGRNSAEDEDDDQLFNIYLEAQLRKLKYKFPSLSTGMLDDELEIEDEKQFKNEHRGKDREGEYIVHLDVGDVEPQPQKHLKKKRQKKHQKVETEEDYDDEEEEVDDYQEEKVHIHEDVDKLHEIDDEFVEPEEESYEFEYFYEEMPETAEEKEIRTVRLNSHGEIIKDIPRMKIPPPRYPIPHPVPFVDRCLTQMKTTFSQTDSNLNKTENNISPLRKRIPSEFKISRKSNCIYTSKGSTTKISSKNKQNNSNNVNKIIYKEILKILKPKGEATIQAIKDLEEKQKKSFEDEIDNKSIMSDEKEVEEAEEVEEQEVVEQEADDEQLEEEYYQTFEEWLASFGVSTDELDGSESEKTLLYSSIRSAEKEEAYKLPTVFDEKHLIVEGESMEQIHKNRTYKKQKDNFKTFIMCNPKLIPFRFGQGPSKVERLMAEAYAHISDEKEFAYCPERLSFQK